MYNVSEIKVKCIAQPNIVQCETLLEKMVLFHEHEMITDEDLLKFKIWSLLED